jgi:ribosomal protein S12 methylthiotransferase accessory factor
LRSSVARASRRIDLESVDHEVCRDLLDHLAARKMAVSLWDMTTDIGVAAFLCRIEEAPENRDARQGGFYGSGCHLARDVALLRAVTEAVQTRLTYIAGSRDDLRRRNYGEGAAETILGLVSSAWERSFEPRRFADVPHVQTNAFEKDLTTLLARLRGVGIGTVAIVDLTRSDFGIPVVRAIAPGLEFIDDNPDYVPGERALRIAEEAG